MVFGVLQLQGAPQPGHAAWDLAGSLQRRRARSWAHESCAPHGQDRLHISFSDCACRCPTCAQPKDLNGLMSFSQGHKHARAFSDAAPLFHESSAQRQGLFGGGGQGGQCSGGRSGLLLDGLGPGGRGGCAAGAGGAWGGACGAWACGARGGA